VTAWALLDVLAAGVLLVQSFVNLNHMQWGTKHCLRVLNLCIAVSALAVILTAFKGGETRYVGHVVLTCAMAALVIFGRRRADKLSA
jgi:hypothetical protein